MPSGNNKSSNSTKSGNSSSGNRSRSSSGSNQGSSQSRNTGSQGTARNHQGRANTSAKKPAAAADLKNDKNQFWSVVLFAVGVLILLMAFIKGTSGWNRIHNGLLGLFGLSVFFVPIVLIYTAFLIGMERSQRCVAGRAVWGIALTILISASIQIFAVGDIPGEKFFGQIAALYRDGKSLDGGGVMSLFIAGPLLAIFGETGAKIITIILFFVFIMLLSGLGLIQFFKLLTKPFRFLGNCLEGFKNIMTGGDFEDAFDDDEEEKDFRADREAIDMVNNRGGENSKTQPKKATPKQQAAAHSGSVDGFLMDIPLPHESQKSAVTEEPVSETEEPAEGEQLKKSSAYDGLAELISQAAGAIEKKHSGKDDEEENAQLEGLEQEKEEKPQYMLPPIDILTPPDNKSSSAEATVEMREKAEIIVNTLKSFGVAVRISDIYRGPAITRYEIQPGAGVKVSKIKGLEDDIALYLAAQGVRIEAPVPGKACVGIEVPNTKKDMVTIRELLSAPEFKNAKSKLTFAVGKDIAGNIVLGDIAKMPHVIIAGTTGSGKSVCTRSIIMSFLYNATPDEVKMILIDPKIVEFKIFDGIPHLLIPIVTDAKKAAGALNWAVNEMMRRYQMFADMGANDIHSYNALADENEDIDRIAQIVVFIDELADMMLVAGKEVEDSICRLAQMGRAAGMHLVVATQRPTTDVITGLIKANIPSRIALSVMSQVDSRTIIDQAGADKLLGNGDMLYMPIGQNKPVRIQGCFASTKEITDTIKYIKEQVESTYDKDIIEAVESFVPAAKSEKEDSSDASYATGSDEDYVERAIAVAVDNGQLSTSMLQRKLKLGYARAARIMDELEEMGVIGPSEGSKPRKVLMTKMQLDERRARMQDN